MSGYAPLPVPPTINQSTGQATYSPQPATSGDPIANFNMRLMEMLGKAQSGETNAPLYARSEELQNTQIDASMGTARELDLTGLRPSDALAARQNEGELYEPEVKSLNNRIALNNEAVSKFEKAIKTAKEFGEEYAKHVKPGEETIAAVKRQMAAGFLPSTDVIERVGKFLTEDDWAALSNAKKTGDSPTSNQKEYEQAKAEGFKGSFIDWLDRNKDEGENEYDELAEVKKIISMYPGEWGKAADAIDREFGTPHDTTPVAQRKSTEYAALLKDEYMTEEDKRLAKLRAAGFIK
jgi:hypothetical protein